MLHNTNTKGPQPIDDKLSTLEKKRLRVMSGNKSTHKRLTNMRTRFLSSFFSVPLLAFSSLLLSAQAEDSYAFFFMNEFELTKIVILAILLHYSLLECVYFRVRIMMSNIYCIN